MSRWIQCSCIPALAIALLAFADAASADAANGFSMHHGGHGISTGHGKVYQPSIQPTIRRVYRYPRYDIPFGQLPYFHGRPHFDYHRPHFVPHNGHIDFVPGHYDFYSKGHWHH